MTQPKDDSRGTDRPPDSLPDVDTVIHDAREDSWQLPDAHEAPPEGAGDASTLAAPTSSEVAYPAADAAHPASAQAHGRSPAIAHGAAAHGATSAAPGATTAAHGAHGEDDEEPLGPVDVELWGAGVLATVIGLFMAICFVLATAGTGAY